MAITARAFDRAVRSEFDPLLIEELRFSFSGTTYHRILASRVIQLVVLDFDPRSKASCRIMLGLNATFLHSGDTFGAYFAEYLTPGGITANPASLRFQDQQALDRLVGILGKSLRAALPDWLERYSALGAFAEAVPIADDYVKGVAYLECGKYQEAQIFLRRYRSRILQDQPSPELDHALENVDRLLASVPEH